MKNGSVCVLWVFLLVLLVLFQILLTVNNECSSSFSCLLTFLDLDVKEVNRLDSSFEARSTTPEMKRTT